MSTNSTTGKSILSFLIPLAVDTIVWLYPAPDGLTPRAWYMFTIFAATIAAILTRPLPSGAMILIALCVIIFTETLLEAKALPRSTSDTVWLISCAYVLSLGFVTSGLGKCIAYEMLSLFGGNSPGIAYPLGVSDLIMTPAMPSVTARSGGIIFLITRSINDVPGSTSGITGKRIGDSLTIVCFQSTSTTEAIFLTGMVVNPLVTSLVKSSLDMEIARGGWFISAVVPAMVCLCLMPLLVYKLSDPELKRTPEAKATGKQALDELDSMSSSEKKVAFGFVLALVGWGTGLITGLSTTFIGLGLAVCLSASGAVNWKSLLNDHTVWDTVIQFSVIISLATGLADLGSTKWMTIRLDSDVQGFGVMEPLIVLGVLYIHAYYLFATAAGHVAALYAPFATTAIAAGVPPMMVATCFGVFSNLMWGDTKYGGEPDPIYFAQDCSERPRLYKINLYVVTVDMIVIFAVGMLWWRLLGYY